MPVFQGRCLRFPYQVDPPGKNTLNMESLEALVLENRNTGHEMLRNILLTQFVPVFLLHSLKTNINLK